MLHINSLYKKFGTQNVLNGIDLDFKKGVIYGVVGENGAGKTTLFRCIAKLEKYKGTISYDKEILKNVIGFLPTNPYLLSKITGREYLQLLCNARHVEIADFDTQNIFDLPLDKFAESYSTGMKKKLALTGVLLQKNEIFILDEPFNGVDIQSNIIIKEILFKLKKLNKIIIISSHIFSVLNETCDVLHHLKSGKIARTVLKNEFESIEDDIKKIGITAKIDKLNLT